MLDPRQRQAKEPVSPVMAGPYGHPFHPILVTVPIGSWVASLVFDVASHLVHDPGFLVRGAMWLIGLGVVGAFAAAMVGVLDLFAIPTGTRAFRVGLTHMTLNLIVTAAYVGNFFWRDAQPVTDNGTPGGTLTLSAVGVAVLGVSGYLGGKLAYHYGVRVADEATQADGFAGTTEGESASPRPLP